MGLVAGVLEQMGIATVILSCLAAVTEQVEPPRWLDLPYPLGFPLGRPDQPQLQRQILEAAIQLLVERRPRPLRRTLSPPEAAGDDT
ncbi:hypothetical protein BH23GEM9_BH23GEM9_14580 [soil metagenome]